MVAIRRTSAPVTITGQRGIHVCSIALHSKLKMRLTATTGDAMRKETKIDVRSDRARLSRRPVKKPRELAVMAQLQAAAPSKAPAAMRTSIVAGLSMPASGEQGFHGAPLAVCHCRGFKRTFCSWFAKVRVLEERRKPRPHQYVVVDGEPAQSQQERHRPYT